MIGWRPVLVTVLALGLVALAVVHADGDPPPCDKAQGAQAKGLLTSARAEYVRLLKEGESDSCVTEGLDAVTRAQCSRAAILAAANAKEGMKAYVSIATAEPVREAATCARSAMSALADAEATTASTRQGK